MKLLDKCSLCGSSNLQFLLESHDRMHDIPGEYSLHKCNDCSLTFVNPQPDWDELARHYPTEDYYSYKFVPPSRKSIWLYRSWYGGQGNLVSKIMLWPVRQFFRPTHVIPGGRLLDVGCGVGNFLMLMKSFNMDCYGVEPGRFDEGIAQENNLLITHGMLDDAGYEDDFFDVITIHHVLEHMADPVATMAELCRILKPGGKILITIPQIDCLAFKFFGKYWVQLDIPKHLFLFSPKTIRELAEKSGFEVEKLKFSSTSLQILGTWLYWTNKFRKNKIYLFDPKSYIGNRFLNYLFLPLAALLNLFRTGDQIDVHLVKR